jgi:hypothetical protein
MADAKPFASLSSGLLARKGAAKPAMRPQGFGSFGSSLEDLGWNDMGHAVQEEHVPTPAAGLTPSPQPRPVSEPVAVADEPAVAVPEPVVVEQQRALQESFSSAPADVVQLPCRRVAGAPAKARAAFTLRIDPERHFKLRLACAVTGRSAQQLVTGALDEFLNSLPEVEAMAERVPAEAVQRSR